MKRRIVVDIISILYILLFVYAALNKLLDFEKFRNQLSRSPIISTLSDFVAVAVPAIEIIISLCLVLPFLRFGGLLAAYFLMIAFTTYIILILNFSYYIPCSCGGILDTLDWNSHLIFNVLFSLLAMLAIVLHREETLSEGIA